MKSNLQYIFDKITRTPVAADEWEKLDRVALVNLAITIGAADRGVAIPEERAGLVADAILASRAGGDARRLRDGLNYDRSE